MAFSPTGFGETIFKERYAFDEHETWQDACRRVAESVGKDESTSIRQQFYEMLVDGYFQPGGRIMYGAGRSSQGLLNCFVVPTEDSMAGWAKTVSDIMQISATGGGVGVNFSPLRGRGAPISRGGESTGAVSLMDMCDRVGDVLRSGGGRRVAMMHCLDINHPDIEEFIRAKREDGRLNNANVSVIIPPDYDYSELKHSFVFDEIVSGALSNGEPGILNSKLAQEYNPMKHQYDLISTNPCVTGDTMIMTVAGPRSFFDLAKDGQDVLVHAWDPKTKKPVIKWMRRPHKTRQNVEILEVEFDSGLKVRCTPDHNFYTFRGAKIEAKDLTIGKSVRAWSMSEHRDGHLRIHGWDSKNNKADHQWVSRMVWESFNGPVPDGMIVHHIDGDKKNNYIGNLELLTPIEHNSLHYPDRAANGFDGKCKNHKVIGIRKVGFEDVYNGCVDDAHTYIICDPHPVAGVASGIVSANCGEIWLPAYGVCCLGALVLPRFVHAGVVFYNEIERVAKLAVRFLDNVLDQNDYPLPETEKMAKGERRLGLGVMGLHSMFMDIGVKYGSNMSYQIADATFDTIKRSAHQASQNLALEKGEFDFWDEGAYACIDVKNPHARRRNVALLTVAPTGTTSMVHGVTSGIEPMFAPAYIRRHWRGDNLIETLVVTEDYAEHGELAQGAYDVTPEQHFRMQAVVQKHVDNAVSKTINLPRTTTVDDIKDVWFKYLPQLKGTTLYREGSRDNEPMTPVRVNDIPAILREWSGEKELNGMDETDPCASGICAL